MEMLLEVIGKFLWDLVKDAVMLFILTKLKTWMSEFLESRFA